MTGSSEVTLLPHSLPTMGRSMHASTPTFRVSEPALPSMPRSSTAPAEPTRGMSKLSPGIGMSSSVPALMDSMG